MKNYELFSRYIYSLEQEKTRLLSQNCQLKRLIGQQTHQILILPSFVVELARIFLYINKVKITNLFAAGQTQHMDTDETDSSPAPKRRIIDMGQKVT